MSSVTPLRTFNLDHAQQQSFVRYYRNLPAKAATTIRFFNRSDYYTVHAEDAIFTAQNLFGTITIKYMGDEPKLSYVCLSQANFEKYVRDLLLVKQYRVEVYIKPTQSKNNDWVLEYKGSPGNLSQFEEILFENNEIIFNTAIIAINLTSNMMVSVASINTTEGTFEVGEFRDNELFTELEALLAQINPRECILPNGTSNEWRTLKSILERSGILVAVLKKSDFTSANIDQDLNRLLHFAEEEQKNSKALPEYDLTDAMGCLQTLITDLNLTADEQNHRQFKLQRMNFQQYVRLDNAAIAALNLLPPPGISVTSRSDIASSVLQVIDKCCTPQGHRLMENWIKQPLKDINLINERLDIVEALIKNTEVRDMLHRNNLTRVPDLLMLCKKLSNKKASLQDCYRIYQTVSNIGPLVGVLRKLDNKSVVAMFIDPLTDLLTDISKYQDMIEETLDMDLVDRDKYFVKPSFSEDLQELNKKRMVIEEKMQKELKRAAGDLSLETSKSIKLECNDQHGYFFRVTLKEEKNLRKNKNYTVIDVIKGGVRFTNNKLSNFKEDIMDLNKSYEDCQKLIVQEIMDVAAGYSNTLKNLNLIVAKVDVLVSFANVATSAPTPFTRPKMLAPGSGILKLTKVRHPCLEIQDTFIPNDVEFLKDEKVLHVITGPNMGGKSTYVRSIGVAVLLAHIGCFVPCAEAEISIVDCILARVGANDSLIKGLSTFMLEMVETSSIIKSATSQSLILIDELGRGTSTYDGCGIAWSIAEYLATKTKCFSLFATHFHELTRLAELFPFVHNWHVTAVTTDQTITPLYQVREGPCDRSYGIHCARMSGFPKDVLDDAIRYQEELEDHQGMRFIKDYETDLKRKTIQEGDALIQNALKELKEVDLNSISDEDLVKLIKKTKLELQSKNLFVQALLSNE